MAEADGRERQRRPTRLNGYLGPQRFCELTLLCAHFSIGCCDGITRRIRAEITQFYVSEFVRMLSLARACAYWALEPGDAEGSSEMPGKGAGSRRAGAFRKFWDTTDL
jgi:hypothetical protein